MSLKKISLVCLMSVIHVYSSPAVEELSLEKGWLFKTGDDTAWAIPAFDDSGWSPIDPGRLWEDQGYGAYDGHAWYRIHVVIPSSLKEQAVIKDSLALSLGMIDDTDQTYLNGRLLGQNGQVIPVESIDSAGEFRGDLEAYRIERGYRMSVDDPRILWDRENVIAVRVHDHGGGGGMYSGRHCLSIVDIKDYIRIDEPETPFHRLSPDRYEKRLVLYNQSGIHSFSGSVRIEVRNEEIGETVTHQEEFIHLPVKSQAAIAFVFNADNKHLFTAEYRFTDEKSGYTFTTSQEVPYILTPASLEAPRINGPEVTGAGPGRPFLYRLPVTGIRPIIYKAEKLPEGLVLNPETGIISGAVQKSGAYEVLIHAENAAGSDERRLIIKIGDGLALTPPLGWNSWNCWGLSVSAEKMREASDALVSSGLADHGWTYLNIDDGWEASERTPEGELEANEKFPDMPALAAYIHKQGLKLGIYSSPGRLTCGRYLGTYSYEQKDAETWARWGVDYLKYDWCSYNDIAADHSLEELQKPYILMQSFLDGLDRDIVYSLCQYGWGDVWQWGADVGGNLWRTTGDITDTWESMRNIGFDQTVQWPHARPGHWNDPDMLVVGWVGWGPELHPTRLSASEQYTHISLWCLLAAPLLLGCDLTKLDDFTLNLLTNDEVLAVNQDILGLQARQIVKNEAFQVWAKSMADGSLAVGLFNLSDEKRPVSVDWQSLGIQDRYRIRDLWRQQDLGVFAGTFSTSVPAHAVALVRLFKAEK